jgi:cyclase
MHWKHIRALSIVATWLFAQAALAQAHLDKSYQTVRVSEGVYSFITPVTENFVSGNQTLIVGKDAALVVDSGHYPSATAKIIGEIRTLTDKPVRYLVNTHWHGDHTSCNYLYAEQFPGLSIISTPSTQKEVANYPKQFDDVTQLEGFLPQLEQTLREGSFQGKPLTPERRKYFEDLITISNEALPEVKQVKRLAANVTFQDKLTIDLGGRIVDVAFLGRGNTGGDAVVWVPDAKTLVAGDLVVLPVPYAFGSFNTEWVETLKRLEGYHATNIVPGHGPVQHDYEFVHKMEAMLDSLNKQSKEGVRQGLTDDQVLAKIDLSEEKKQIAGDDKALQRQFNNYFLVPGAKRSAEEARKGRLSAEY